MTHRCGYALALAVCLLSAGRVHPAAAEEAVDVAGWPDEAGGPVEPCHALFLLDCSKERPAVTVCDALLEPADGRPGCADEPDGVASGQDAAISEAPADPVPEVPSPPVPEQGAWPSEPAPPPAVRPADELGRAREALRQAITELGLEADLEVESAVAGRELILRVPVATPAVEGGPR